MKLYNVLTEGKLRYRWNTDLEKVSRLRNSRSAEDKVMLKERDQ